MNSFFNRSVLYHLRASCVLIVVVIGLIYIPIIQPIIHYFYGNIGYTNRSTETFIGERYTRYRYGSIAEAFFPDYENLQGYNTVKFYYKSNLLHCNLLYGAIPDVFAVDVYYEAEEYESEKEGLLNTCRLSSQREQDVGFDSSKTMYYFYQIDDIEPGKYLCFNDDLRMVRWIYLTKMNDEYGADIYPLLLRNSALEFPDLHGSP